MHPGLLHAVYTPEDCLCVGGHFLIAPHVPRSLSTAGLLIQNPQFTNDDHHSGVLSAYRHHITDILQAKSATPTHLVELILALKIMIDALKGVRKSKDAEWQRSLNNFHSDIKSKVLGVAELADIDPEILELPGATQKVPTITKQKVPTGANQAVPTATKQKISTDTKQKLSKVAKQKVTRAQTKNRRD